MSQLVYGVAASLDGFIAEQKGEYDWLATDSASIFASPRATGMNFMRQQ